VCKGEGDDADLDYLDHSHITDPEEVARWHATHAHAPSVLISWPHFSLQPSLTRVAALVDCGPFGESSSYFEYQYALGYAQRGWRTAFLPRVVSVHIGRLCNDFDGPLNAYELLGQEHFGRAPRLTRSRERV
jgi:hypothetical protein